MKILLIIDVLLIAYILLRKRMVENIAKYDLKGYIEYMISKKSDIDAIIGFITYALILTTIIIGIIKMF